MTQSQSTEQEVDAIDELLERTRITDVYGKNERVLMVEGYLDSAIPFKEAIQRLIVEARLDEVQSAITAGGRDERADEDFASQMSYVVGYLARRSTELEAQLNGKQE